MYLSFNHTLEVMKNTMYKEQYLEFDTVILTFTRKGTLSYITKNKQTKTNNTRFA